MTASLRIAAAVAVVALAVGGLSLLRLERPAGVGPGTLPSPTAPATPKTAPTLFASADGFGALPSGWSTYHSNQYGYRIGYPTGWTTRPATRAWTAAADATDSLSAAQEGFLAPAGDVRVSVWSVPLDPSTSFEDVAQIESWVEQFCRTTNDTPCTGIPGRAVPLCLERRDCHPGVLVPFRDDVLAFFTAGIYDPDKMIVAAVWRGESDPSVARYGGARHLLEAFLSTMEVWPESTPLIDRKVRDVPVSSPTP